MEVDITQRKSFIDYSKKKKNALNSQSCPANKRAASGGSEPHGPGGFKRSQDDHMLGTPDCGLLIGRRGWAR